MNERNDGPAASTLTAVEWDNESHSIAEQQHAGFSKPLVPGNIGRRRRRKHADGIEAGRITSRRCRFADQESSDHD